MASRANPVFEFYAPGSSEASYHTDYYTPPPRLHSRSPGSSPDYHRRVLRDLPPTLQTNAMAFSDVATPPPDIKDDRFLSMSNMSRKGSLLGLRSRGGTPNSSASSCYSQALHMHDTRDSSQTPNPGSSGVSIAESTSSRFTLFSRASRLRRQGSKLSLNTTMEPEVPEESERRSSGRTLFGMKRERTVQASGMLSFVLV